MSILDGLLGKIVPHACIRCGSEGELLCPACRRQGLSAAVERCYRCQEASQGFMTCAKCRELSPLLSLKSAVAYEGAAKDLIWKFKSSGAQAAAEIMAARMLPLLLLTEPRSTAIVPVPTATSRVRQRGFDQTRLIARQLAKQARLPWVDCLVRLGQAHQVGAGRGRRLKQLEAAFWVSRPRPVRGTRIILVDDVATTGSTLETAAQALYAAGAHQIRAVTFAQTK